ncbi:hypothetical protein J437_LFUL009730 [Ladona fulva]|uniref:glutathione transferase n=1 Tax=Ladona fulva TaxID=123851 RepID=A0A8K0KD36_LADFU|nr:hypothetical protein J437_LFUL009730 [Ladona fulva]
MAPTYKLTYFDVRALAEPIRYLLAYGGIEFEDHRVAFEQWPAMKNTTPYGKLPIMEVDGEVIHQSPAMARYLGRMLNLAGDDEWESLLCDMVVDAFTDLRMLTSGFFREKDQSIKEKKREPLFNETIPFYLDRLDKQVEENSGHFVRGKLTWADFYIVCCLETIGTTLKICFLDKYPNLKALTEKINNLPQIKEWIEKRPKTIF